MVDTAIQAIAPEMDAILSAYSAAHEVVKTWDSICDLVMKYPNVLWWKRCAAPTTMGAHPANRGNIGFMMSEALVNAFHHMTPGRVHLRRLPHHSVLARRAVLLPKHFVIACSQWEAV